MKSFFVKAALLTDKIRQEAAALNMGSHLVANPRNLDRFRWYHCVSRCQAAAKRPRQAPGDDALAVIGQGLA